MSSDAQHGHLPVNIGGVLPNLAVRADAAPARSESGVGAMMAWANRLWFVTYVSHTRRTGTGTGLFELDADLNLRQRPESVAGTYANRLLHPQSHQAIVGPHLIDPDGNVRTIEALVDHRLAATMEHLTDPDRLVYFLTMEGLLFEVNVHDLGVRELADLTRELAVPAGAQPHFKSGHTANGRVYVTNNTYDERDYLGQQAAGRLAEWDGEHWTILERTGFNEVTGRKNYGAVVYATGWDRASALLKVFARDRWRTYRLPKASQTFDHFWQTEWPRIREVEHERFLMDCHGLFYELSPAAYGGQVAGLRPIATHLRVVPDFCAFGGFLVLGGNQATPTNDSNLLAGQPQAGLWLGKTDDLWSFGKPQGWGGPWRDRPVAAGEPSDPYLMTGFDQKVLHLRHDAGRSVAFTVEVDFLGDGSWQVYDTLTVPASGYQFHVFPPGFSAQWIRLATNAACTATAHIIYT